MKKILFLILMAGMVNAGTVPLYGSCTSHNDCQTGLYCWGGSPHTFFCYNQPAVRSNYVPSDSFNDCYYTSDSAGLWPVKLGDNYVCSECKKGTHKSASSGIDYDTETLLNMPMDAACRNPGYTCSCDLKTGENWNRFASWNSEDDHNDSCSDSYMGNDECYTPNNLQCRPVQSDNGAEINLKCFTGGTSEECVDDADCNSGLICNQTTYICQYGTPVTTTTLSSTTTTLSSYSQCSIDEHCPKDSYCQTGFNVFNICVKKHYAYTIEKDGVCYKNHECLNGVCSANNLNSKGDYPSYTGTIPYDVKGTCTPSLFIVEASTNPTVLNENTSFSVYVSTTKSGNVFNADSCGYYFAPINEFNYFLNNLTTGWAYDDTTNDGLILHNMNKAANADKWNFISNSQSNVNKTINPGVYPIDVYCLDSNGNIGATILKVKYIFINSTQIKLGTLPSSLNQYDSFNVNLQLLDGLGVGVNDATCIMGVGTNNFSMENQKINSRYEYDYLFNESGNKKVSFWCSKTNYQSSFLVTNIFVESPKCHNGIKDSNEEGVDCGGDCLSCSSEKGNVGESCNNDDDCLTGYCVKNICKEATCFDGVKNQNEISADCGGPCRPCMLCLGANYTVNDCSTDGSLYCLTSNLGCWYNNCTTSADCKVVYDKVGENYISHNTVCDTDGLCRYEEEVENNGTTRSIGMDITPITNVEANISGKVYYTLNCENNNAFRIKTNDATKVYYQFLSDSDTPSIPALGQSKQFCGETCDPSTDKTDFIPELCNPVEGFGGMPTNVNHVYSKIMFTSYAGNNVISKTIDVITYRKNLQNSVHFWLSPSSVGTRMYAANATDRNIEVSIKAVQSDSYSNVTSTYVQNAMFNASAIQNGRSISGIIYYKVTSQYGESYEGRYGGFWWMFMEFDPDSPTYVKFNFQLQSWHIYIILAFVVAGLVYYNHKRQEPTGPRV